MNSKLYIFIMIQSGAKNPQPKKEALYYPIEILTLFVIKHVVMSFMFNVNFI